MPTFIRCCGHCHRSLSYEARILWIDLCKEIVNRQRAVSIYSEWTIAGSAPYLLCYYDGQEENGDPTEMSMESAIRQLEDCRAITTHEVGGPENQMLVRIEGWHSSEENITVCFRGCHPFKHSVTKLDRNTHDEQGRYPCL